MDDKALKTLLRKKVTRFDRTAWVGYLTCVEILALVDGGIVVSATNDWKVRGAQSDKRRGDMRPGWFYFELGKGKVRELMADRKHEKTFAQREKERKMRPKA